VIVECHGSLVDAEDDIKSIVLYGDNLPDRFFEACKQDFGDDSSPQVDLMLVLGTALQVAPVCAVPNLAPRGCTRVLVNRDLHDCFTNDFSFTSSTQIELGGRTVSFNRYGEIATQMRSGNSSWLNLTACDDFVRAFVESAPNSGIVTLDEP